MPFRREYPVHGTVGRGPGFNIGMSANQKGRDKMESQMVKRLPSGCGLTGAQERGQGVTTSFWREEWDFLFEALGGEGLPVWRPPRGRALWVPGDLFQRGISPS